MIFKEFQISQRALLIGVFVLLNLSIGLLFHKSLAVVCISELFIIAVFGLIFWNVIAVAMKSLGKNPRLQLSGKNLWLHGGLAIPIMLLSIFLSHFVVVTSMVLIYDCSDSPGFDLVNTSLANNAALNLLCYFGLTFIYFRKSDLKDGEHSKSFASDDDKKLFVDRRGIRILLAAKKINYIETSNNCIIIHTDEGKFVKYQSLKKFLDELKYDPIQRIHKSYAVNIHKIESMRNNKNSDGLLTLKNGSLVKFSRNYNVKQLMAASLNP